MDEMAPPVFLLNCSAFSVVPFLLHLILFVISYFNALKIKSHASFFITRRPQARSLLQSGLLEAPISYPDHLQLRVSIGQCELITPPP